MPDTKLQKKLQTELLSDFHCHCDFSIDAKGTIDEYCQAALTKGLAELCFTTHYDSNPNGERSANVIRVNGKLLPTTVDNLEPYVEAVRRAAENYLPLGLSVRLGVEFGWYPGCENTVDQLRRRYAFDYILCGIHEIENVCFCCRPYYERCFSKYDLARMLELYFSQAIKAAESGLFNTIAHLDYYKKYGLLFYGDALSTVHQPYLAALWEALTNSGTCLEINTAAVRKGLDSYFPSISILNDARQAGVGVRYLGSDAHTPADVGFDFDAAAPLISSAIVGCED